MLTGDELLMIFYPPLMLWLLWGAYKGEKASQDARDKARKYEESAEFRAALDEFMADNEIGKLPALRQDNE